jgi:4-hydroxy-tetrahydrodipicolinate synthase
MIMSFAEGNTSRAAEIHRNLVPLFKNLFIVSNPIPLKYALNHIGFRVGGLRLPLTDADEKPVSIVRETLKNYVIDLPL